MLFLLPSGPGDTSSQAHLPLGVEPPADIGLANYDIDRDGDPGLLIEKDSAGVDGSDPTKVQIFTVAHSSAVRIEADLRAELYVAAKDFDSKDILVAVLVERCDLAGTCMALGYSDKWVRNADRFKRVTVPLGDIATTIEPGDRLQLRVAALGESDDDMWLAFGTDAYSSSIHFDD